MKVFADTNVLIAGAASNTGASYAVLRLAEIGLIDLYVSKTVIEEAERNVRKKMPAILSDFIYLLTEIKPTVLPDPPLSASKKWEPIIEAKDAPILAAAVTESVDRLLTLNTKDFTAEVAAQSGLTIQTPGEFILGIRDLFEGAANL